MPIIPAIGVGLAALGGGSAIAGAGIAATAIGGVASAMAAGKQAKAVANAGQLTYQASQDTIASNERLAAQAREDYAPARAIGNASMSAMGAAFGLPGYGPAPSMTAPRYASTPVPNAGGVSMTGKSYGGSAGTSPIEMSKGADGTYSAQAPTGVSAPQDQNAVWDAYLAANPDVAAWAASGHGDPALGPSQTPEQAAAYHYQHSGQAEGRQLPAVSMTQPQGGSPAPTGYQAPAGYTDPTAPSGYSSPERPAAYTAPARGPDPTLDVSAASYRTSPGYAWQMEQGQLALDHVASAGGGIMSGARQKAALRFSQGLADQNYQDWRGYTTQQFNTDRARTDNIYSEDRGFGYGQNRDGQSDFQTDRGYTTGRYDQRNSQLMSLAGFGQSAAVANTSAATSFAQNSNAARMTGAQAQGDAAVSASNVYAGLGSNLMSGGLYLLGRGSK